VKPNVIRELLGTKTSTQFVADDAILFASGGCTVAGRQVARENNVRIIGRTEIEEGIHRIGVAAFPALLNPDDKRCPKCGARMVLRENVAKPFWGCSTYPRCRGKIERVREAREYGD
jgi:restriction system protein